MAAKVFMFQHSKLLIFTLSLLLYSLVAHANPQKISGICERAAQVVASETNVPLNVLRAISLTETGRKRNGEFRPWPWTVNMEGIGKWFNSYEEAKNYVDVHFRRGARSFDVGCFQINYRWHNQAFSSIEHMFEPTANARYAAKFLSELYDEFGSWPKAAGAYHSRTPKFAKKYTARFNRIRANLKAPPSAVLAVLEEPASPESPVRINNFPLLRRSGSSGGMASLVPLEHSQPRQIIDVSNSFLQPVK